MKRGKALVLAAFTIWPFIYIILFMASMMLTFAMSFGRHMDIFLITCIIMPLHFLTILEIFVLTIIYVVYLFKTDIIPQDKKALWAIVLFLGNIIAMPVFWYFYIWLPLQKDGNSKQFKEEI